MILIFDLRSKVKWSYTTLPCSKWRLFRDETADTGWSQEQYHQAFSSPYLSETSATFEGCNGFFFCPWRCLLTKKLRSECNKRALRIWLSITICHSNYKLLQGQKSLLRALCHTQLFPWPTKNILTWRVCHFLNLFDTMRAFHRPSFQWTADDGTGGTWEAWNETPFAFGARSGMCSRKTQ